MANNFYSLIQILTFLFYVQFTMAKLVSYTKSGYLSSIPTQSNLIQFNFNYVEMNFIYD